MDDTARGTVTSWASTSATRLEHLWAGDRYATYIAAPMHQPQAAAAGGGGGGAAAATAGVTAPVKRHLWSEAQEVGAGEGGRGLRSHHELPRPPKAPVVVKVGAAPLPPPPPTPLAAGAFLTVPVVSSFLALLPGGLSPQRVEGLLFQIITPGIASSFDCQGQVYRLPTSACAVEVCEVMGGWLVESHEQSVPSRPSITLTPTWNNPQDPQPEVSVLHNFATQRGLAANGDAGFNRWLLNETVALICGSSMDPFGLQKQRGRGADPSPQFARFFDPVDGTPVPDMFGGSATMAAALVFTLLNPDAPNVAETPPISHDLVFSMVRAFVAC